MSRWRKFFTGFSLGFVFGLLYRVAWVAVEDPPVVTQAQIYFYNDLSIWGLELLVVATIASAILLRLKVSIYWVAALGFLPGLAIGIL